MIDSEDVMPDMPVIESEMVRLSESDGIEVTVADSGAISLEAVVKDHDEIFSLQLLTDAGKIDALVAALLRAKKLAS